MIERRSSINIFKLTLSEDVNGNTPMQYTAIFHGYNNDNFHMKNCDIFLIFAQNIDQNIYF